MTFVFRPKKVFYLLLCIIGVLTTLNLIGIFISQFTDLPKVEEHLVRLVSFDKERNIPTYYSSLALLFAALLLGYIAAVKRIVKGDYKSWLGLCLVFVFLSIDEAISFHELLSGPMRKLFDLKGIFYLAWVVPYGVFVIIFFAIYLKFMLRLPPKISLMFLISGGIFVIGAIGFELIGSSYYATGSENSLSYTMVSTVEELFEMVGIAIFIYSLLFYIQTELGKWNIKLMIEAPE